MRALSPSLHLQARHLVAFTRHGVPPDAVYKWSTLDAHIQELLALREVVPPCVAVVEQVVFWRRPLASLAALVVWQLVCLGGGPAALWLIPLLLLVVLAHTYRAARAGPAIHCPPGVGALLAGLLLGWMPSLQYTPPPAAPPAAAPAAPPALDAPHDGGVASVAAAALAAQRAGGGAGGASVAGTGACPRAAAALAASPRLVRLVEAEQAAAAEAGGGGREAGGAEQFSRLAGRVEAAAAPAAAGPAAATPPRMTPVAGEGGSSDEEAAPRPRQVRPAPAGWLAWVPRDARDLTRPRTRNRMRLRLVPRGRCGGRSRTSSWRTLRQSTRGSPRRPRGCERARARVGARAAWRRRCSVGSRAGCGPWSTLSWESSTT